MKEAFGRYKCAKQEIEEATRDVMIVRNLTRDKIEGKYLLQTFESKKIKDRAVFYDQCYTLSHKSKLTLFFFVSALSICLANNQDIVINFQYRGSSSSSPSPPPVLFFCR